MISDADQRQMPLAAEDELGLGDAALGLVAETRYTVLADADDGQPSAGAAVIERFSRHDDPHAS